MHSFSFVPAVCRVLFMLVLVVGSDLTAKPKDKAKVINDDLVVAGDAAIDGHMSVTGDLDVAGSSATLGTRADTFGLGTFYLDSGLDGVRWRLNREAGWVWEVEFAGSVHPVMRLDESNRLVLYANGLPGVVLDPLGPSLALGDLSFIRSSDGVLQTNAALLAANLSGINTGDQSRADLNLGPMDAVKFGRVNVGGADPGETVFVADDNETDDRAFVILADGTHQWREGNDATVNLHRSAPGTLQTDGAFVIGSPADSGSTTTGALTVAGGAGIAGNLHVGGDLTASSVQSTALTLSDGGTETGVLPALRFGADALSPLAGVAAVPAEIASGEGALALSTRSAAGELNEQLRLTGEGHVGIGTAEPAYRLDVAGEVRVSGTGPSVFKGPVLLAPQGDLPMGEFTAGLNPHDL